MAKNSNQTIKCNVCSCKYNDDSKYPKKLVREYNNYHYE